MQPNDRIGPYKVVFLLKKEEYDELYRVIDEAGNRRFLKLFNLAKLSDCQYDNSITDITEIAIAKHISHPNVLKYVNCEEMIANGQRYVYMVYDFITGETVAEKLKREAHCSVYEVKQIATGVLNALKYLHCQKPPVIYNAISPDGVMIDISNDVPQVKLTNFSRAQTLETRNRAFYAEGLNPFYMAPEMFKGLYSTRTDLYAVGVLMYHMLFGMVPWYVDLSKVQVSERIATIIKVRKQSLPIPDVKIFELDDDLLSIIAKAVNQDVDKRFQNAEDFLNAINGVTDVEHGGYQVVDASASEESEETKSQEQRGNGFADVAGMNDLKERLQREVIDLIRNPEKYKRLKVKIPNGMLLYGPPGCGKTFIAEKFAEELGCNYIYVHCSDVAAPYIHGGQEKIAALFQQAKDSAPTVLFLDEIDAMIADRSRHTNVSEYGEVNEFLTHLNNCADNHIFVIGATNNPKGIDPAALRSGRLDIKVYVPAPDLDARKLLFQLYLNGISESTVDCTELARLTDGYVSRDICTLVNKAALETVHLGHDFIAMATLLDMIRQSKGELPSVTKAVVEQQEKIRDEFEGRKSSDRPRVGFSCNPDNR